MTVMHHPFRRRLTLLVAGVTLVGVVALTIVISVGGRSNEPPRVARTSAPSACRFLLSRGSVPAFCDTFDHPAATGTRSGDLDGTVWGVSRATSTDNAPQGQIYSWAAVKRDGCGAAQTVLPAHDVAICDHQLVEAVNDNGGVTVLAMYPKQPFDFAGRTGTVSFDVSDDSQGNHAAWPEFVLTDQPVPAPHGSSPGVSDNARNSIGFSMARACGQGGCGGENNPPGADQPSFRCVGIDSMYITSNYQFQDLPFNIDGCVLAPTAVGSNNHVEVQFNSGGVKVYASDAGRPDTLRLIADASFAVPLTRGLIWLEDIHYNANKYNTQQSHTFSWANIGFDGPVLPRDLGFDAPDSTVAGPPAENGLPTVSLGYNIPGSDQGGQPLHLTVPKVTGIANASGALLTLTYTAQNPQTLIYSINGHTAHRFAWPFGTRPIDGGQTAAMPMPLSELRAGDNSLEINTSDSIGVDIANVSVILVGAGGTHAPTSTSTGSPTPTAAPSPSPKPAVIPINDVACTVVLQTRTQSGRCSGTFVPG
jgi:hypothetical protein